MGLFGKRIDPATGRQRSETKRLRALAVSEGKKADAAIARTKRLHQQRMSRRNAASN
jgi:hypothetical protein